METEPPPPPRRPAKDQSEINRIHRLSSALNKHHPLLRITQVTGTHAGTHGLSTGKTTRWTRFPELKTGKCKHHRP